MLLYVGRYTEVKRLPLLIEAYAQAAPGFSHRAPLVLVGGFPGEWEGEHPLDAIRRTGARDVFLAGWHDHAELPDFLAASDAVVLPSVREQFGQVLVEGGACGLPAIAVDAHGPAEIVRDGETGWLVPADDRDALAAALAAAVKDPEERRRRGVLASEDARAKTPGRRSRSASRTSTRRGRLQRYQPASPPNAAASFLETPSSRRCKAVSCSLRKIPGLMAPTATRMSASAAFTGLTGKRARRQARRSRQKRPGAGTASTGGPSGARRRGRRSGRVGVATFASSVRNAPSGPRIWANMSRRVCDSTSASASS